MPDNLLVRAIRGLPLIVLISWMSPAWADITYNYDERWLFDSNTGLYWQVLQVPNSTFMPNTGTVPDDFLLHQLETNAGISAVSESAPYSSTLADFLSFFASGTPAVPGAPIDFIALYQYPHDRPQGGYQYAFFQYRPDPYSTDWEYVRSTTIGLYGPGQPWCRLNVCQPTQPAFVYSAAPPVPLPASAWLLLSGLALLGARRIKPTQSA